MARYLMTHSLLSSWLYSMASNPYEDMTTKRDPMAEFMSTLNREQTKPSGKMLNGITFENLVTAILRNVAEFDYCEMNEKTKEIRQFHIQTADHKWYDAAAKVAQTGSGGALQYRANKTIVVGGLTLVLYGRLDCLKAGDIKDIKFSSSYDRGKYFSSTQHPTYFEIVPEAKTFTYLVSNGSEVWTERYYREETPSIIPTISDFLEWLDALELAPLYKKKWLAL